MQLTRLLFLASAAYVPLWAQSNFATLTGSITDAQGRALRGAHIEVRSAATGAVRDTIANETGLYDLPNLLPGSYTLKATAAGFAELDQTIRLEVGQEMRLDLPMAVGEKRESIQVSGGAELLKTSDASLGEVVETKSVQELPLNGRMLLDLAVTVPGAHVSHGAQAGDMNPLYWRPGQASALSFGGNRPNANYFLVDGVTNTDPTFNTQNISLSPDAVQEFQVQAGSYTADMGGAGGGQINIVTRTGTSQFHGTLYEFLRNNAMDAVTFNEMSGDNHLVQNNFGASVGGPLPGKKTFFFLNYEGLQMTQAMTMFGTVPTSLEASGNFSESGTNIYDPATSHKNPNYNPALPITPTNPQVIRDQYPNNTIPASRINPVGYKFLQYYVPQPNVMNDMGMGMSMNMGLGIGGAMGVPSVVGAGLDSNNYMDVENEVHKTNQGTARVDRTLGNSGSVFARYSAGGENGFSPENFPGFGVYHGNLAQNGNITWIRIITPSIINTASAAVSRLSMFRHSQNNGTNDIVAQLGIQGVGYGGPEASGSPYFNVQGFSGLGDNFLATPMHAWDTILEGRDDLSWEHGRHSFRFGGAYRWYIWPMWGFFQNRGYYQFTNGFTTQTATNDNTGSGMASFLLGLPAVSQVQAGVPSMDLRQWQANAYAEDTWRVSPRTTVVVGLRYEFMDPLVDVSREWSNLEIVNGKLQVFIGGQNGMPRGLMYPNKLDFAPRFGLTHAFRDSGFVWRVGYGIFYTPVDLNTWCNQLHNVPLVFPETKQSDNFTPSINGFNWAPPVLGKTVVSYAAFDPHPDPQYVQQWTTSIQKSLGSATTLEVGYLGERGFHLQQAHLINNALPGPGLVQPRRPYHTATFVEGTVIPDNVTVASLTFPVSSINMLQNTAQSWYDAGYINVRRRFTHRLGLLTNYTYAKNLTNAPDFRSPMFESSIPQNNNDLDAEKGSGCDIRHRFSLSLVYQIPGYAASNLTRVLTSNWQLSTIFQAQSGYPFTISVFGDTANAGTILGENPIRANYTGQPVFTSGTHTADLWFNPAAFATPPAVTFGSVGRNTVYGPGLQMMDIALVRNFAITERARFQLRGEFFNALNHTNLGTPNRFVNEPQFGTITDAATPGREVQLGARLSF
jgi:outer membrane receptor protein involved in Fe transport